MLANIPDICCFLEKFLQPRFAFLKRYLMGQRFHIGDILEIIYEKNEK